eukprot:SAG31_NODE_1971_length_6758_cov_3.905205_4_plen_204_part_00
MDGRTGWTNICACDSSRSNFILVSSGASSVGSGAPPAHCLRQQRGVSRGRARRRRCGRRAKPPELKCIGQLLLLRRCHRLQSLSILVRRAPPGTLKFGVHARSRSHVVRVAVPEKHARCFRHRAQFLPCPRFRCERTLTNHRHPPVRIGRDGQPGGCTERCSSHLAVLGLNQWKFALFARARRDSRALAAAAGACMGCCRDDD